jgi:hypothetical protein
VQNKLSSFSHSELDTPANHDPQAIIKKFREGKILFSGQDYHFSRDAKAAADMPEFIKLHPSRFSYLVTRNAYDAGFQDTDMLAS